MTQESITTASAVFNHSHSAITANPKAPIARKRRFVKGEPNLPSAPGHFFYLWSTTLEEGRGEEGEGGLASSSHFLLLLLLLPPRAIIVRTHGEKGCSAFPPPIGVCSTKEKEGEERSISGGIFESEEREEGTLKRAAGRVRYVN